MNTYTYRAIGKVIGPSLIEWEDGETERFDILDIKEGRFEAMVTRMAFDDSPVSITDVKPLGPPPTQKQCDDLWESIMKDHNRVNFNELKDE